MDLETARRELRHSVYQWALQDARREVVEDFRLVRQVRNASVLIFLDMMSRLSREQRVVIAELLVKRMHREVAEYAGDGLNSHEAMLIETWVQERGDRIAREAFIKNYEISRGKPFKIDRKRLCGSLKKTLTASCGPSISGFGKNDWRHQKALGIWSLETFCDVGGRMHQLSYGHSIIIGQEAIIEHVSLLAWLGISGQTHWNIASDTDEQAATESLKRICHHFVEAVPTLVADVSVRVGG